ncbi:Tat-binding-like protein 7 [Bienertia sinuspersici]
MKTHLTTDAGKEIIDKKIEFNEFILSYFHPQVSRCGGGGWAMMMNEQWWVRLYGQWRWCSGYGRWWC